MLSSGDMQKKTENVTESDLAASILGRANDALSVIEISGGSLDLLYDVMRQTVGHNQRAYSTGML